MIVSQFSQALRLQLARACASRLQRRAQRNTELAMQKLAIAKQAAEQQEQLHRQALHDVALVLDELIADSVESIEFPDVARAKIEHKRALEQARQEKETADAEQRALLLQLSQKPVNELSLDEMFLLATREDLSVEDTVSHETRRVADVPSDKGVGEDVDEMAALSMLEAHEAQAEHREQMELQRWQSQVHLTFAVTCFCSIIMTYMLNSGIVVGGFGWSLRSRSSRAGIAIDQSHAAACQCSTIIGGDVAQLLLEQAQRRSEVRSFDSRVRSGRVVFWQRSRCRSSSIATEVSFCCAFLSFDSSF
jgi:hypothetical protein